MDTDIEALIEGLPESEYCKSYVFQAFRSGGGVSRTWIYEALLRHGREALKRKKRSREAREKEAVKENMEMQRAGFSSSSSSSSSNAPSSLLAHSFSPAVGMRVRVRFSKDRSFGGTITTVQESTSKKKRKPVFRISIQYDDGSTETLLYPDPDVSLLMPGTEEEIDADGNIELVEMNGKPVTCAVGTSPLEAWGNALVRLGLIDEVMLATATEAVQKS